MPLLKVERLAVGLERRGAMIPLVEDASFALEAGEIMGLVGESGSGKTVSCRALMRLLPGSSTKVTGGSVLFEGQDLLGLSEDAAAAGAGSADRDDLPEPAAAISIPVMTIGDQVAEPLRPHRGTEPARGAARGARPARPGRHPRSQGARSTTTRTSSAAACASAR